MGRDFHSRRGVCLLHPPPIRLRGTRTQILSQSLLHEYALVTPRVPPRKPGSPSRLGIMIRITSGSWSSLSKQSVCPHPPPPSPSRRGVSVNSLGAECVPLTSRLSPYDAFFLEACRVITTPPHPRLTREEGLPAVPGSEETEEEFAQRVKKHKDSSNQSPPHHPDITAVVASLTHIPIQ